jgi:hypothetical protein
LVLVVLVQAILVARSNGSNSVFSTITSTGGGGGGSATLTTGNGGAGGGGGAKSNCWYNSLGTSPNQGAWW